VAEPEKIQEDKEKKDYITVNRDELTEENSEVVYHYSREHRLSRASSQVLAHNNEIDSSRPGAGRIIFGRRSNFFILASILLIIFVYSIGSRPSAESEGTTLSRNIITLSVLEEGTILFLAIEKKTPARGSAYIGPVDIAASPVLRLEEEDPVFMVQRVFFTEKSPETFFFSLPFEAEEFIVILQTENETIARTVKKEQ
jgi:hypothetical protein